MKFLKFIFSSLMILIWVGCAEENLRGCTIVNFNEY